MKSTLSPLKYLLLAVLAFGISTPLPAQTASSDGPYSKLWGKNGELWDPSGRLTDFSFAGYHSGEAPIPKIAVKANVKDFGAKGDGTTDDTDAFKKAIEATAEGAILIPAGRYVLSDIIYIRKPNLVLRGEGTDKTVLFFSKA